MLDLVNLPGVGTTGRRVGWQGAEATCRNILSSCRNSSTRKVYW